MQITIKQDSYTKANESGEEAQKETMRLIDIGLPQSKNKVNSNQPKEICSHLTEKASKGRFPKPENGSKITVTMVTKEKERGKRKR